MKKLTQFAITMTVFGLLIFAGTAESAYAQKWNKQARKEYKQEIKQARKEYRRDVREARKEWRQDQKSWRKMNKQERRVWNRTHTRGWGYYNVRPYRGARRAHIRGRLPRRSFAVIRPTKRGYIVRQYR